LHISRIGIKSWFLRKGLNHLRKILKIEKMDDKEELQIALEDLDKAKIANKD
jgi:hypothetical protein